MTVTYEQNTEYHSFLYGTSANASRITTCPLFRTRSHAASSATREEDKESSNAAEVFARQDTGPKIQAAIFRSSCSRFSGCGAGISFNRNAFYQFIIANSCDNQQL
jgi:hypothetical protein